MSTVTVVDPAAEAAARSGASLAPRRTSLQGARLALVDNSKHMAAEVLDEVEAQLKARFGVAEVARYRKANPSIPMPPEVLAKFATSYHGLVHGVAD